jgi:hypothetical protein
MTVLRFLLRFAFCLAICANVAKADSIQLRNGRHLQGKYIGGTSSAIGFMTGGSVEYFATAEVLSILFDSGSDPTMGGLQQNSLKNTPTSKTGAKLRRISSPLLNHPRRMQTRVSGP